jgi:EmrB/QacA subfamily drug resistance transporter
MEKSKSQWIKMIIAVGIGSFMASLDASVVNIALPQIGACFKASLSLIEWVVMAYLLVISSLLLTYGRLGDMYGHKQIYVTGFLIFTAGSVLCGLAPTIVFLIVARMFQAIGAGMLMAMGPAIITDVTPGHERGKALGLNGVAVYIGLISGPVLGGILTTKLGWQSIFFINIPIGIIGTWMAGKYISSQIARRRQKFDISGAALLFAAMVTLLWPLSSGEKIGWSKPVIILSLLGSVILFTGFIATEIRAKAPMMDLTLFRDRLFTMSNVSLLISFIAGFSVTLLMPFYFQQLRGLTPYIAGLMMIPQPIATIFITPVSGILSDRIDSRYLSSLGMLLVTVGMVLLSNLTMDSTPWESSLALIITGLGNGLFQTPNSSAIMGSAPENQRGIASGMMATMRNIGMVLGIAVAGAVFTGRQNHFHALLRLQGVSGAALRIESFTSAFHTTYLMAATIALVAVVASLTRGSLKRTGRTDGSS